MDWEARVRADPVLSGLLSAYGEAGREKGIIILGRNGHKKPRERPVGVD